MRIPVEKTIALDEQTAEEYNGVVVRADTWRKIMALVNAVLGTDRDGNEWLDDIERTSTSLRKHLEKRK